MQFGPYYYYLIITLKKCVLLLLTSSNLFAVVFVPLIYLLMFYGYFVQCAYCSMYCVTETLVWLVSGTASPQRVVTAVVTAPKCPQLHSKAVRHPELSNVFSCQHRSCVDFSLTNEKCPITVDESLVCHCKQLVVVFFFFCGCVV